MAVRLQIYMLTSFNNRNLFFTMLVLKQYTEEKLGQAEKTELDAHFENLLQRADNTRQWTESILSQTEAVLQPNPSRWSLCL